MPGIPRSKGCQACKDRKTKCDQKWPTCSSCKKKGLKCPGPTSLVKFVYDNNHKPDQPTTKDQRNQREGQVCFRVKSTKQGVIIPRQSRSHHGTVQLRATSPSPRAVPGTMEDLVASRLINHMAKDSYLDTKNYFKYIPSRIASSASLRESVNLFCSTMTNFKRHMPSQEETIANYGRALRSLISTLEPGRGQATKVETLASIAFLGRSEGFLDPSWRPFRQVHSEGILLLILKLGPPEPDDHYHGGVLFEVYEMLIHHAISKGTRLFIDDPPWNVRMLNASLHLIRPELREDTTDLFILCGSYCANAPVILRKVFEMHSNPHSPHMTSRRPKMRKLLEGNAIEAYNFLNRATKRAFELGYMTEFHHPDSLAGTSYQVDITFFGRILMVGMTLRLAIARILYDLSVLYDSPDAASRFSEYRAVCVEAWKYTSLLQEVERVIGPRSLTHLMLTFEGADEQEKEDLIDTLLELDDYHKHLPRDRDGLASYVTLTAKVLTGRLPAG